MTVASLQIAGNGGDASCPSAMAVNKNDLHDQLPGPTPHYSVVSPLTNVQGFFNFFRVVPSNNFRGILYGSLQAMPSKCVFSSSFQAMPLKGIFSSSSWATPFEGVFNSSFQAMPYEGVSNKPVQAMPFESIFNISVQAMPHEGIALFGFHAMPLRSISCSLLQTMPIEATFQCIHTLWGYHL